MSEAPVERNSVKVVQTFEKVRTEEERKEASMKAMFEMALEQSSGPLAQDLKEGVAEDEWD